MGLTASLTASTGDDLCKTFLPLLFGAAWKILDFGLELAFANARITPPTRIRWLIKEKVSHAKSGDGSIPGFIPSSDLWRAITSLYVGTYGLRHTLVHRQIQVDATNQDLVGYDEQGAKLIPVKYDEQVAFCRFAQRFAQAICDQSLMHRLEGDLRGQLTLLQSLHGIGPLGGYPNSRPVRVVTDLAADNSLDIPTVMAVAKRTFSGAHYVDVEIHLGDGRLLVGELESAPQTSVSIDPKSPPSWLRFL